MNALLVLPGYVLWHYVIAPRQLLHIYVNLAWFIGRFFNISQHAKTLFAPWHRIVEKSNGRFDLEEFAGSVAINLLSRLVGACIRLPVIVLGITVELVFTATTFILFIAWLSAPLLIPALVLGGTLILI